MQSLEQGIHLWTQESARDRADLKESIVELKDAVIALTKVQSKTAELEQDIKEIRDFTKDLEGKLNTLTLEATVVKEKLKTLDFIKRSAGVVFLMMISMIIYLGWANLQLQDIHNRDIEIIQHIHVPPQPFQAIPNNPLKLEPQ